jgi:predicted phosphodiesterase
VRILAFSDLHGNGFHEASSLIDQHRPHWLITCGDMLPDFSQRPANYRLMAQQEFWRDHRHLFIRPETVTTMIVGNHELPGFLPDDNYSSPLTTTTTPQGK